MPSLDDIADAVGRHLKDACALVSVTVTTCPNLRPFGCAQIGLGGRPALIEIGGEPHFHNPEFRAEGSFDLRAIADAADLTGCQLIGVGFPCLTERRASAGN